MDESDLNLANFLNTNPTKLLEQHTNLLEREIAKQPKQTIEGFEEMQQLRQSKEFLL